MLILLLCLVPLVSSSCRKAETVCEDARYFRRTSPATPESLRTLGEEVPSALVQVEPTGLTFPDEGHVTIWWLGFGHMSANTDLLFSPGEDWARRAGDAGAESYPLTRRKEQGVERARLAFESLLCTDPEVIAGGGVCTQYGREKVPLIAEMTCKVVPRGR